MSQSAAVEIANLLYRYAELMDAGDLAAVAGLFDHARMRLRGKPELLGSAAMLETWRRFVRLHPDGTPRTKHVITNPIIEIDEALDRATCRSYYTVLQATEKLALQVIAAGRYHDEFERLAGRWRLTYRDYSLMDLVGALDDHLLIAPS